MLFDVIFSKICIYDEKKALIFGILIISLIVVISGCIGGSGDDDGDGLEDKSVLNSPQESSFLNFEFQKIHSDKGHGKEKKPLND